MSGKIIDGKKISESILLGLKKEISKLNEKPKLSIILCGDLVESVIYTDIKKKKGTEIGIDVEIHKFPEDIKQDELIKKVKELNKELDGLIVQLPLPKLIDTNKILSAIEPSKDVDGLTQLNFGKTFIGEEELAPATPLGIIRLLEEYNINIKSKDIVIIGKSNIVGKPLAFMLANRGATVTLCHNNTKNLKEKTLKADIVVSATGKPNLITKDMVKEGVVIIDAGYGKKDGKAYGDVCFDEIKEKASYITPVPGGVGPMTVAMLLENTLKAYKRNKNGQI
jgi:methylenetetrahydrofolate dehydrogenase (NADP+) / methenyltetrahydrofolate cyclohydrolase